MDREPAVAGRFYAGEPGALRREVDRFLAAGGEKVAAKGLVAPHAGYLYSGAIAGAVYARVSIPARVVILGPNHTGLGKRAALWPDGVWRLPTGAVPIDPELTAALAAGREEAVHLAAERRRLAGVEAPCDCGLPVHGSPGV